MIGADPGKRLDVNDISLEDMDRNQQTRKAIRERREMKNKKKKPMNKRSKQSDSNEGGCCNADGCAIF